MFKVSISENGLKGEYITCLGKIFHELLDFFLNMFFNSSINILDCPFSHHSLLPLMLEFVLWQREAACDLSWFSPHLQHH